MRIGIIGGGIAGLACAHYLLKAGHEPVVLEAENDLGGHSARFVHDGLSFDRFPRALMETDSALCGLMSDLGALGQLSWRETHRAVVADQKLYPWDTWADLMRFSPVGLHARIRAGLANLYLTRSRMYGLDLDRVPALDWLRRLFGSRFLERVWIPLLRARFGDQMSEVPAYWPWRMLNRHMRGGHPVRGCIRSGFGWLADQLQASIESRGGEVRLQARVSRLFPRGEQTGVLVDDVEEMFDGVISTVALPLLEEFADPQLLQNTPLPTTNYVDMQSVVLMMRTPLDRFDSATVLDESLPFQTIVESTHVLPTSSTAGYHLVYLLTRSTTPLRSSQVADDVVQKESIEALRTLYRDFDPRSVKASFVFRAAQALPVWTVGQLEHTLPTRMGDSRVYLCTNAQAYPRVPCWDTSVALSRETVTRIVADFS